MLLRYSYKHNSSQLFHRQRFALQNGELQLELKMSSRGSPMGEFALSKLAADLQIDPHLLKPILEEAFDMVQQNGNPSL